MTGEETPAPGSTASKTAPLPFDTSTAHQARMYDYVLGGKDNYATDRAAVEEWAKVDPGIVFTARANRAFLGRVVRYLTAEAGIRQFLDIGTGIPTAGNTHQVAQAIAPETRVVYVDYDPVVLAHARALLDSHEDGGTGYIDADLRDTGTILGQAAELLDFTRPVAVTLLAILHVIPDADDPHAVVGKLLGAVPAWQLPRPVPPRDGPPRSRQARGRQRRRGPDDPAGAAVQEPRAGGPVLRGHGPGRTRAGAGRGMAAGPRRGRGGPVLPVVRCGP